MALTTSSYKTRAVSSFSSGLRLLMGKNICPGNIYLQNTRNIFHYISLYILLKYCWFVFVEFHRMESCATVRIACTATLKLKLKKTVYLGTTDTDYYDLRLSILCPRCIYMHNIRVISLPWQHKIRKTPKMYTHRAGWC